MKMQKVVINSYERCKCADFLGLILSARPLFSTSTVSSSSSTIIMGVMLRDPISFACLSVIGKPSNTYLNIPSSRNNKKVKIYISKIPQLASKKDTLRHLTHECCRLYSRAPLLDTGLPVHQAQQDPGWDNSASGQPDECTSECWAPYAWRCQWITVPSHTFEQTSAQLEWNIKTVNTWPKRCLRKLSWVSPVVFPDFGGPTTAILMGGAGLGLGCLRYFKGFNIKVLRFSTDVKK